MAGEKTHWGLSEAVPSLPAAWYIDRDHHGRELTEIWNRSWLYVCHAAAIADPRAFQTLTIGDQNIVVVRDEAGVLRAYHNTCRHRGSLLCLEAKGRLKTRRFVCPYHNWAYGLSDGHLAATTSASEPDGFDAADYGLFPVAVAEWRGFVFVHLDPSAVFDAAAHFARSTESVENYPLEDMIVAGTWQKTMACNWKLFWENFNECLHCPNVHPELARLVPIYGRRISNPRDVAGWEARIDDPDPRYSGGLRAGAETWSVDGSAQGRIIDGLSADDLAAGQRYVSSYPGVFFGAYADHVRSVRILPKGPEETDIAVEWLVPPETAQDPAYDRSHIIDFGILVMEQDAAACEGNQRGLHAQPFTGGVLMPEEHWVKDFHDWVRAALNADSGAG